MSAPSLTRYWIEFTPRVCGVTAASLDDVLALVREVVFRGQPLPPVRRVIEHVDIGMLEKLCRAARLGARRARHLISSDQSAAH